MNMIVTPASPATPNGTTRPQVRIVIVGHVDHGKSTLVGRLLHETGSLPDGKLEMLKAVSARRGMPFEWSFLLDALQTERDQGITIDTTQIRFRTNSRDIVLIDAPGHAEFLRNMITGASQADGAVLIIDALEGVRDQTRRHGYLLHLLGVKQVAVVVNKMDRVDFSRRALRRDQRRDLRASQRPRRDADGDHPDLRARRRRRRRAHRPHRLVQGPDRGRGAGRARAGAAAAKRCRCACRCRRSTSSTTAASSPAASNPAASIAGDEIVIMPAGKIAKIKTIESWPVTPVAGRQGAGRSVGITLDRELFVERGDIIAHADTRAARDAAAARAHLLAARQAARQGRPVPGPLRHRRRAAPPWSPSRRRSIPASCRASRTRRSRATMSARSTSRCRSRLPPIPTRDNPRTGRLVIEVNGRIAGGGLVLSVDAGQRAVPVDIVPVESGAAARRTLGALSATTARWSGSPACPASGKSTLARALERRLFSNGGSPILLDGDTLRAGLNGDLGFSAADRSENIRRLAEVATHLARNGHIAIVAAVSPAREDRAAARRIADSAVPRDPCRDAGRDLRGARSQGPLREGPRRRAAVVHRHRQRLRAARRPPSS